MVVPCSEVAMSDAEKESEARCKAMLNKLISMVKEQTVEMEALVVRLKATVQPLGATVHASSPSVAALTATCAATEDPAVATATPRAEAALAPKSPTRCSTNCSDDDTASQTFTLLPDAAWGPPPTTTLLDAIPDPNVVDAKVLDSGLDSEAWLKASARPMRVRQKHALSQSVGKPMQEIDMANVYVGRFPSTVTADQLVELFRPFGQIVQARMFKFPGYGMVRYDSPSSAAAAIDHMDGYHIGGSTLGVRVARLPAEFDAATNAPTLQMTGNEQGQIDMTNLYVCCSDFSCVVLLNYVRWQHFPGPSLTNVDHLSINEESSLMTQHISHEPAVDREACPELLADATTTDGSILDKSISCLPGTTSRQYCQLEDSGFHTVRKLLQHFPRTYADLQNPRGLIEDGQYIMLFGTVVFSRGIRIKYTLSFLEVVVGCSIIETESNSSVKSFNSEAEQKMMIHLHLKKFFSGTRFSSQSFLNCISSKYREGDPVYVSGKGDVGCGKTAVAFLACMEVNLGDYRGGCKRNVSLQCQMDSTMVKTEADRFYTIEGVRLPDNAQNAEARSSQDCQVVCLNNCSCNAYAYNINGCIVWHVDLVNLQEQYYGNGSTLFLRLAASEIPVSEKTRKRKVVIICALIIGGIVVLTIFASVLYMLIQRCCRERALWISNRDTLISFQYSDLKHVTKNFVEKLGGGAFGSVFKGRLPNSTFIAVKRLERLHHGEKQFRAEVSTIGMINHVNLVRLLGFCVEETRRLLVYEYMQGGSLDFHLFRKGTTFLDWNTRYKVSENLDLFCLCVLVQQKHGGDWVQVRLGRDVLLIPWDSGGNGDYFFVSAWGQASFKEGEMSYTSLGPALTWAALVGRDGGPGGNRKGHSAQEYKGAATASN